MPWEPAPSAAITEALRAAAIVVVILAVVFAVLVAIGFVILARRSSRSDSGTAQGSRERLNDQVLRANIALVRLDDDVTSAADEFGYAIAQFGEDHARALGEALGAAREDLATAFRLNQQLDDSRRDTVAGRESVARIIHLAETSRDALAAERAALHELRGRERDAPRDLDSIRARIEQARARIPGAFDSAGSLAARFAASAVAPVVQHPAEAEKLLESASRLVGAAAQQLADPRGDAASTALDDANGHVRRATTLLDQIDQVAGALAASSDRLESMLAGARSTVGDARRARDAHDDPATAAAVGDAIVVLERAIAGVERHGLPDPDASIARLEAATDALDSALARARNREQRLAHAREALTGALAAARSQLETTRTYIGSSGERGAGAEARTRLAEAVRLLALAEIESDPVVALDTARASATYSRDADALARYDLLH